MLRESDIAVEERREGISCAYSVRLWAGRCAGQGFLFIFLLFWRYRAGELSLKCILQIVCTKFNGFFFVFFLNKGFR